MTFLNAGHSERVRKGNLKRSPYLLLQVATCIRITSADVTLTSGAQHPPSPPPTPLALGMLRCLLTVSISLVQSPEPSVELNTPVLVRVESFIYVYTETNTQINTKMRCCELPSFHSVFQANLLKSKIICRKSGKEGAWVTQRTGLGPEAY